MTRLRHIAICSKQQETLAAFYRSTFGLTEVMRHESDGGTGLAIYLSDGEMNLAIIPATKHPEGINHFGFAVDDVDAIAGTAVTNGAQAGPKSVPRDGRQNEAYIADPIGQRIDLSSAGWIIGGGGMSRIEHVAVMTDDPPKLADFYTSTFGMHVVFKREKERGAVYLSDGYLNLAVLPNGDGEAKGRLVGVNHFGFHVADLPASLDSAYANGATKNDYALPRDGRFAETFVFDPAGQRVDLSQSGWKLHA